MEDTSLEKLLKQDGYLIYKTRGSSMHPMLVDNKSVITLRCKKENERFKENDVVLYKRKSDKALILHRIVKVNPDDYVLLGDNCFTYEFGIKDEAILGSLVAFKNDDKTIKIDDEAYLAYVNKLRKKEACRIKKKKLRFKIVQLIKSLFFIRR